MDRRWRGLLSIWAVLAMTLLPNDPSRGRERADPGPALDEADRADLLRYARATWASFEAMTDRDGLPSDLLRRNKKGEWRASGRTTPTDIAAYLWSTLAARSLGLIDDAEADRRLGATLETLGRAERVEGFFLNFYDVATATRSLDDVAEGPAPRPFLSSVDNGWLAAALMMVGNTRPALRSKAEDLLRPMDFGFFYVAFDPADPANRPGQFHGGYSPGDRTFSAFYGMLNTEPRIISYIAIARGQVPPEHYYRLFRTLPADRGRQSQEPRGEARTYRGVPVFEGHYQFRGFDFVPSWGGSMFEALMVPLFVPEERWSPRSWGENHPLYARIQIETGLEVRRYGFWGFSPSATPEGGYQTFGVASLGTEVDAYRTFELCKGAGLKDGPAAGPVREGVVTPHASFLALRYVPGEAMANLRAIEKAFPIFGPQGFRDSVNVTSGEVSASVLALDQGMILAAIANALGEDTLRHAFSDGPVEAAIRPLIAPEEFTAGDRRR